jgi:hypothetical protein
MEVLINLGFGGTKNIYLNQNDMSQQTLDEINNDLNQKDSKDDILRRLRGFYFYYNEPNEATHTILIHREQCGFCRFGAGTKRNSEPGRNGAWVGPFSTPEQAEQFALRHFPYRGGNVGRCSCV